MSNQLPPGNRSGTFKQIDVGKAVVLNDSFITENHSLRHAEAIVEKTMQNAEELAAEFLAKAKVQAQEIVAQAQVEAQRIITEEGEGQRDALLQKGYDEGFSAGFAQGVSDAQSHCGEQIAAADALMQVAYRAQARVIETCRDDMLALMHSIMSMVLSHELHFRPEYLAQIVHHATTQIETNGHARVILHPETLRMFKDAMKDHYPTFCKAHHLSFTADPACPKSEVYLETVEASYNISPDAQAQNYLRNVAPLLEVPEAIVADVTQTSPSPEAVPFSLTAPELSPEPEVQAEQEPAAEPASDEPTSCLQTEEPDEA